MIYKFFRRITDALEHGFYIETSGPLSQRDLEKPEWLIRETFAPDESGFLPQLVGENVVEIGPRLSIETPDSSNAVAIVQAMGIENVLRIERTNRFLTNKGKAHLDRMTEQVYPNSLITFDTGIAPESVKIVDLIGSGQEVLERVNKELGLGMDAADIEYYFSLFAETLRRNPTDVELFQIGNANSEHSRHWFFKGRIVIDGATMPRTLLEIVQSPLEVLGNGVTLKAFNDNAGVSRGFSTKLILPITPGKPSEMQLVEKTVHITATAETHNHPTMVEPFQGAATGAGGRIRDTSAVGRGGITGIGAAGYFIGNLFISGYEIPGEVVGRNKPSKYVSARDILIQGSNGLSAYGNQYGEPVTLGFTRAFGQIVEGKWREPRKPVLYSAGIGHLFDEHLEKEKPEVGMLIVRVGGPAYPIGVGGGSASSMMQGENTEELDFNSVQRGNAEMENRVNRVIRACAEMGKGNPIASIHDQGAGGPSNVLTELMEPLGGRVNIRNIVLGDKTMSDLQIWSAEFQEGYGLLIRPEHIELFKSVCSRERVNCEVLGTIDGSGNVVVEDPSTGQTIVDLNLEQILSKLPQKTFVSTRRPRSLVPLDIPAVPIGEAIEKVFKQLSVGSKGFLVHKVDRSVTGLVAQQQTCGIEQISVADVSVNAQSHFGLTGAASAIGEQPLKMLIDPKAGARMAVAEMLTNLASARISGIGDIRCRANWMWPAKLPGEGAFLYDAATAMANLLIDHGIAVDGGKDSSSMAATVESELVKAPGSLVIFGYAPIPDITRKVTPDIKKPGKSRLGLIDLGMGKNRLGGSAYAQSFNQLGNETPDIDPELLRNAFNAIQQMIDEDLLLAMHDRSDGGLIATIAEMCMASRCGFGIQLFDGSDLRPTLFSEELGWVLEFDPRNRGRIETICSERNVPFNWIGNTRAYDTCSILSPHEEVWKGTIIELRLLWESTSSKLEEFQMNPECAREEYDGFRTKLPSMGTAPSYELTFVPRDTDQNLIDHKDNPRIAILREEGTNGDREMAAVCKAAGLRPFDINMEDLLKGNVDLDSFQGLIFPGGFSFKDVLDSGKGWAGVIRFNKGLREMFERFYARTDTFSLGVCNGAQFMALSGFILGPEVDDMRMPRFIQNTSRKLESRWTPAEILRSPAMMFKDMEGSRLPIWVNHGEGRLFFPDQAVYEEILRNNLAPLAYIDPFGNRTQQYPYNPNGSVGGLTALCSPDGRHLAMMPHPERSFRLWQFPWMPSAWKKLETSPWLRMFQNARSWCLEHSTRSIS